MKYDSVHDLTCTYGDDAGLDMLDPVRMTMDWTVAGRTTEWTVAGRMAAVLVAMAMTIETKMRIEMRIETTETMIVTTETTAAVPKSWLWRP